MPTRVKRDKILSNLDDDLSAAIPTKRLKCKRNHIPKQSKTPRLTANDFYRSTVHGEGLDLFIETKIFQDYLQCEAMPWTYPKRSTDNIELQPIPSAFLPPLTTDPIYISISVKNGRVERVRRVCGYREIFMKRMHIEYLKDKEKEDVYKILYPKRAIRQMDSVMESDYALQVEVQKRFRHLAPGGGSKKKKTKHSSKNKTKSKKIKENKHPNSDKKSKSKKKKKRHVSTSRPRPIKHAEIPEPLTDNITKQNRHKTHKKKDKNIIENINSRRHKSHRRKSSPEVPEAHYRRKRKHEHGQAESPKGRKTFKESREREHSQRINRTKNKKTQTEKSRHRRTRSNKNVSPRKRSSQPHEKSKNIPNPFKVHPKTHAEAVGNKLNDWVNHGNQHRARLSQPDENANYLTSDTPEDMTATKHMQYDSLRQRESRVNKTGHHTILTMQDEQTPAKIAEQFRAHQIPVFTAAVAAPHNPHPHPTPHPHPHPQHHVMNAHDKHKGPEKPVLDITNFESYYKYVFGIEIKDLPERDSEWLDLSVTDEEKLDEEIQNFDKETPKWMIEGISFESQHLVTELSFMYWICQLSGRMFYYTVPNFLKGQMEFSIKGIRMIPFFLSTLILWASLVVKIQSYASIIFEETTLNATNPGQNQQQVQVEQLEINKYGEACFYVIANLAFVAVWSVMVILRDGQLITHYLNCWCAALAEMETSSAVGIEKLTAYNLIAWVISSGIIVVGFVLEFPANVRGTAGLLAILMFRNIFPDIRLQSDDNLFYFQLYGLLFILYVNFCARMLFALMQILALILKNSAEMWNFKFALTFNQLMMTNRGHMKRLSLKLPLIKFFNHHRIMTALVKIYGDIFGVPMMIYLIVQIGLMTYVLVRLFNFKAGHVEDYQGKSEALYEYYPHNIRTKSVIKIKFYHSPVEEISTSLFILIMVCFDYMFTTEVIAAATQSFRDGFEFVRRTNLILCKSSHQRRLIQSLLWSMSDTDPTELSAGNYFAMNRSTIVAGLGVAVAFFSLIIQLQSEVEPIYLEFPLCPNVTGTGLGLAAPIVEPRCRPNLLLSAVPVP